MPGGNQNAKGMPNRNLKGISQVADDTKTLSGAEIIANPKNLMLFHPEGGDYELDIDYGLPSGGLVAASQMDQNVANGGDWSKPNPEGSPIGPEIPGEDEGKNTDPYGGGFEQ